jgi:hypothetical protein
LTDCPHTVLAPRPEESGARVNVYECRACGTLGFRRWTRRGLTPFKLYATDIVARRRDAAATDKWLAMRAQKARDQKAAEAD